MSASTASRNSIKEFWHKVEQPKRIANIGAGETHWWHAGTLPKAHHYDLIPRSSDVIEFDCTVDVLPQEYDIVVMRWVLNHLSARMAFDAFRLVCPKTEYIIMTHKPEGKQTEYWAEHGLELPEPIAMNEDWEKWKLALFRAADIYNRLPDPLPA